MLQDSVLQDTLNHAVTAAMETVDPIIIREPSNLLEILQSVVLPISIVAIIFGACFGILFLFLRSWHKQRMLMIEKGTIEKVKGLPDPQKNVRICLMILGAALGATIGLAFPHHLLGLAIFSITIGFTAIGYLVYYYIFVWKAGKKKEE